MQILALVVLAAALLIIKLPGDRSATFYMDEQEYLTNYVNLTSTKELSDFIEQQSAIYIDNAYSLMQKFFYKILGELPRSPRTRVLNEIANKMDRFLDASKSAVKLRFFDNFVTEFAELYDDIFEFDEQATALDLHTFNDVYVTNGIDEVLLYANIQQARAFVMHTVAGIRQFLIHNQSRVKQLQLLHIKAIIAEVIEQPDFRDKRKALKTLMLDLKHFLN